MIFARRRCVDFDHWERGRIEILAPTRGSFSPLSFHETLVASVSSFSVGKQIEKWPICSQFRLTNWLAELFKFILAFWPYSELLDGASNVSTRLVCASANYLLNK